MSSISGDFVRATEWRRVREFATDAASRVTPTALVIEGEAGAGKSWLWRAALEVAANAGCRVLRSEPSASEADSPFAGLSGLLAAVLPSLADGIPRPQLEAIEVALLLRSAGDSLATALVPSALPTAFAGLRGPDDGHQIAHAYGDNTARLLAARKRYAPDGIFSAAPPPNSPARAGQSR